MKVLHICLACIYSDGYNYQENYLSKYHAKQHDTYLITNQFTYCEGKVIKTKKTSYINKDNVHIIRLESILSFLTYKTNFYIGIYKQLYKEILNISPDIIFIHNIQFNSIRAVAKYANKHSNVVVYADNHADFSNSGRNVFSKLLLKTEWRHCAQIINPYVKKFYGVLPARVDFLMDIYKLPPEKCELLVMGADDDSVSKVDSIACISIREKYGIMSDDFLIVTGGKIDLFKAQTINLLEAVYKISNPKVKLILFGSVVKELKEKVESYIDNQKIFYEPWLSSEQSYLYFGAADLAVFPGRHSVYWEQAAGQGKPMICKFWEGTTHVDCGGNVIFLYDDTVEEIFSILNELVDDTDKFCQMKNIAVSQAMQMFSYRNIAERSIS